MSVSLISLYAVLKQFIPKLMRSIDEILNLANPYYLDEDALE